MYLESKGSDQPTDPCSIFKAFTVHLQNHWILSLRKYAYSNILKILPPKNENFQIKNSDIFQDSAQNIDCEYSLELPR